MMVVYTVVFFLRKFYIVITEKNLFAENHRPRQRLLSTSKMGDDVRTDMNMLVGYVVKNMVIPLLIVL